MRLARIDLACLAFAAVAGCAFFAPEIPRTSIGSTEGRYVFLEETPLSAVEAFVKIRSWLQDRFRSEPKTGFNFYEEEKRIFVDAKAMITVYDRERPVRLAWSLFFKDKKVKMVFEIGSTPDGQYPSAQGMAALESFCKDLKKDALKALRNNDPKKNF
jgi:hypothetical protein